MFACKWEGLDTRLPRLVLFLTLQALVHTPVNTIWAQLQRQSVPLVEIASFFDGELILQSCTTRLMDTPHPLSMLPRMQSGTRFSSRASHVTFPIVFTAGIILYTQHTCTVQYSPSFYILFDLVVALYLNYNVANLKVWGFCAGGGGGCPTPRKLTIPPPRMSLTT